MSSGAITLKCPHCGGVFLTLQHGGIVEICPHCAVGAPRSSFTSTSDAVGLRQRAELPPAKREAEPVAARTMPAATPPVLDTPFPMAPEIPVTPASAPSFSVVQAAPTTHEIVPRTPADPQISAGKNGMDLAPAGETAAPVTEADAMPQAAPPSDDPPILQFAAWPPPAPTTPESAASEESADPSTAPPIWPGLDPADNRGTIAPFPTETVQRSSNPELEHRPMPKRHAPWFTVAMLGLLVGSVTWLAFQGPKPIKVPQVNPAPPAAAPASLKDAVKAPVTPVPVTKAPVPAAQLPEPAPEVKTAIPNATPAEVAAMRARAAEEHLATLAEEAVKGLGKAVTQSDRLQWVDATETQQEDMKRFFKAHHGKFEMLQLEPSAGKVTLLPSGEESRLFRLTTPDCRVGAILQVREDRGRAKLRWGLFEQSHEKTYDRFLAGADGSGTPHWFTLICQRGHSFELKGATKDQWICIDAQGSLGASGTGQVYVNKDSPVGRFLEPKALWGHLYLAELLIGKMDIDGSRMNVVLDCAGLQAGIERR